MNTHSKSAQVSKARNRPQAQALKRAQRHWEQGVQYASASDWTRAQTAFYKAVRAHPQDPLYLINLARSQMKNGAMEDALRNSMAALDLEPDSLIAREMAAACLKAQLRHDECAALWQQVPDQVPLTADYYRHLAEALANAGQHQQAISALFEGLGLSIDDALSHYRLAVSFSALGLKQEAAECCRTATILGLGPQGNLMAQGMLTLLERELCRWEHADAELAALRRLVVQLPGDASLWTNVFAQATLTDDPQNLLRIARSCARFEGLAIKPLAPVPPRPLRDALRVGFVSADFQQHATTHLMAGLLEELDKSRFEITLYSHGPQDSGSMRERLKRASKHFVDVSRLSNVDVAQRIRDDGIEVLVDLKGHTQDNRLAIFAYRPAPVQVSFLGFPGTTGADYMDYFIGDAIVSPLDQAGYYSEKLALMPRCYQPNDRLRPRPMPSTREEFGLPRDALVLCGFNQPFKLSPQVFDVWCRLLHRLPGSVLWLLQWNDQAPAQLRAQAHQRGIDPSRLVFAPRVVTQQHMTRLALADLFIDTWPCNGHTTASDALWAGLPVITYSGPTFASRVAASLLDAVGLPDLVTCDLAGYEAKVLELAQDGAARTRIRDHLAQARDSAPLFDSRGHAHDFGRMLWAMAERWSQGHDCDHIVLTPGQNQ